VEIVEKKHWATEAEIVDYYALSPMYSGNDIRQYGDFVGRKKRGHSGRIAATLGVVFFAFFSSSLISALITIILT
jgi:chromate transporter